MENNRSVKEEFDKLKDLKPSRKGNYLGEKREKFYVALSPEEIYELSPLAYYVWLLCDGKHTVKEIAKEMSKDLSMPLDQILEPLIIALKGLSNVNLVIMKRVSDNEKSNVNEEGVNCKP